MDEATDRVYTISERLDGPCRGVADFEGAPHYYQAEPGGDGGELGEYLYDGATFSLTPISAELFALALEAWAIWERWEEAWFMNRTTRDTHPALPADRARNQELAKLLAEKLVTDPARAVRAVGNFSGRPSLGLTATVRWQREP